MNGTTVSVILSSLWRSMEAAVVKAKACGRSLCFVSKKRALWSWQFGTNIVVGRGGWGAAACRPWTAASTAACKWLWVTQNP